MEKEKVEFSVQNIAIVDFVMEKYCSDTKNNAC